MSKLILDAPSIERAITRMAHEIVEKNKDGGSLALVGIQTRGVVLAKRLQKIISDIAGPPLPLGVLDINLYRDDLTPACRTGRRIADQPVIRRTEIGFDLTGKTVVLVDDVLFTGRTIRSALDALIDFGRPKRIELAVLIDRGHRELPIRADFVGKNIPTSPQEQVIVRLTETDRTDEVVIE